MCSGFNEILGVFYLVDLNPLSHVRKMQNVVVAGYLYAQFSCCAGCLSFGKIVNNVWFLAAKDHIALLL